MCVCTSRATEAQKAISRASIGGLSAQKPFVEVQRPPADRVPRVGTGRSLGRGVREALALGRLRDELLERPGERAGVAGRDEAGGAVALGDLGEAADRA